MRLTFYHKRQTELCSSSQVWSKRSW